MTGQKDWERDERSFSDILKAWAASRGSRRLAADELRIPITTLHGWCAGRHCEREATIRRLMTLIDEAHELAPALSKIKPAKKSAA